MSTAVVTPPVKKRRRRYHRCDQCEAAVINGVYCHERGCPNINATYSVKEGRWKRRMSRPGLGRYHS